MLPLVELIDCLATFEMASAQYASLLELCKHPVHRCQTHVGAFAQQHPEHVFGGHMALRALLENLQDLQPRQSRLEPGVLEFVDVCHDRFLPLVERAAGGATATMLS